MAEILGCCTGDLADGESLRVKLDEPAIAIHRVDGDYFATADSCTHERWSLGEDGALDGYEIVCSLHMAAFDVRTGDALRFPAACPLRTYPVRIADDEVWVQIDTATFPEGRA